MIKKIIVDENIPNSVRVILENSGFDVVGTKEKRLLSAIDSRIIGLAKKEKRLILSRDKDFIELWHQKKEKFPVIVLRMRDQSKESLERHTLKTIDALLKENIVNSLIIVTEEKITLLYSP